MNKLNLRAMILNNRPKANIQKAKDIQVTRAGVAVNPLTAYNVSTGNVLEQFTSNVLAKHGDYGFVGGDTLEVAFDFGTKVAGSVVGCPVKIYRTQMSTLQPPTNITTDTQTGFVEETLQAKIDAIKTVDGATPAYSSSLNGGILQLMVELDLTPLCNQLFGGSNAALKVALKSITADVWVKGSGSNGGVLTDGVNLKAWGFSTWNGAIVNNTNSISKITFTSALNNYIDSNNKIYLLVHAAYPSNGSIPSSVSLDFAQIKIGLSKVADTVTPKTVSLPKYWAMVGDFSPCFDSSKVSEADRIFTFYANDNNRFIFYRLTDGRCYFTKIKSGITTYISSSVQTFSKNQSYRYIVGQSSSGMFMYLLKNNGTVEKVANTDITELNGQFPLHILNHNGTEQADMFSDIFGLYDLQALGKTNGFTDAEAEGILRGVLTGKGKNLFDEVMVNGYHLSVIDSKTITVTSYRSYSPNYIPINPLKQYYVKHTGSATYMSILYYDSNKDRISHHEFSGKETLLGVPVNTAFVRFGLITGGGNYTPSTYNFQLEEGTAATTYEPHLKNPLGIQQKNLFDINAVTLHVNASRSGNTITLNATGDFQSSYVDIPVLPNNKYEIQFNKIGNGGYGFIDLKYNNLILSTGFVTSYDSRLIDGLKTLNFTTSNNTNKIRVLFTNYQGSTITFSNISLKLKM